MVKLEGDVKEKQKKTNQHLAFVFEQSLVTEVGLMTNHQWSFYSVLLVNVFPSESILP